MKNTHLRIFFITALSVLVFGAACQKTTDESTIPKTPEDASEPAAPEEPPKPRFEPVEPPPGDPGPIIIQLQEHYPNHVFNSAANESTIAITYQADIRDAAFCPQSAPNTCFKGYATFAKRANPTALTTIELYESDTQSQARVEAIAPRKNGFGLVYRNGYFAGDEVRMHLLLTDNSGNKINDFVLGDETNLVLHASAITLENDSILACWNAIPKADPVDYAQNELRCAVYTENGPVQTLPAQHFKRPVRNMALARWKNKVLIAWQTSGELFAAFSDNISQKFKIGESTSQPPLLAGGHSGFLALWMGTDNYLTAARIEPDGQISSRLRIAELPYVFPTGGLSAIPQGFLFANNRENPKSVVGLIEPDATQWFAVDDVQTQYLFYDFAALDIQSAHLGKFFWQTTASLIGTY